MPKNETTVNVCLDAAEALQRAIDCRAAGDLISAIALFSGVIERWPSHDQARFALATSFLEAGRPTAALGCLLDLESECGTVADSRYLISSLLASEGYTSAAKKWLDRALMGAIQPRETRMLPVNYVTPARLVHDCLQLEYLLANRKICPSFSKDLLNARKIFEDSFEIEFSNWSRCEPGLAIELSSNDLALLHRIHRKVVHLETCESLDGVLNTALDWMGIEGEFRNSPLDMRHVVIDNFLNQDALNRIQSFLNDSWIWFNDAQKGFSYLGAYRHNGLACPAIDALAKELQLSLPHVLSDIALTQVWAYRNILGSKAVGVHADFARINVNLWLTPDCWNKNSDAGGLRLFSTSRSESATFDEYNGNDAAIASSIRGARELRIPYRCNRAVIFDSSLFHGSERSTFAPTYSGLRTNLTMLFG